MAKKKSTSQKVFSPEKYIKEKARTLPIVHCYMDNDWQEAGEANIVVVRKHPQGTFTLAHYLVDTWCLGVKGSFYRFSLSEMEYAEFTSRLLSHKSIQETPYEEAHNLIYGAVAFAEEAGIKPDKSFALTQYLLEEDTDEIPLIEYEYGKNGQHCLVANSPLEASRYLPLLEKNLGQDFQYSIQQDEEDLLPSLSGWKKYPETAYTYQHPTYPDKLELKHPEIYDLFIHPDHIYGLPKEDIDRVLALPHDELRQDLEQILLYTTGRTCDKISQRQWDADYTSEVMHALFFLGEVGNEESLKVVLETLRQNEQYYDFHFGDSREEIYIPTLYLLAKDRLDLLMDYIKEPGLYTFARLEIFPAVAMVAHQDANRREEVIEWFRQVLVFYTEKLPETTYCDASLAGMMLGELLELKAKELLPELKALFDTGSVDESCCGDFDDVKKDILSNQIPYRESYSLDIYQRYQDFQKKWGNCQ